MRSRALASTAEEVTRLQGEPPPLIPEVLAGNTRLTGLWRNRPFEAYMPGMDHHVLVGIFGGVSRHSARIEGRTLSAPSVRGTISLAARGHDGFWRAEKAVEVTNVFLSHDRLQDCADHFAHGQPPELLDRVCFPDRKLFALLDLINQEVATAGAYSRLFLEQLIDLLCLQLLREHSSFSKLPAADLQRGLPRWQVRRVSTYMRERLGEQIGLQELADLVGLSRYHFCSAFRRATGYTPHGWLTRQRMALASKLLADPSLRVTDIALAVGYETASAFAAAFRKAMGATPTAYRRRL